MGEARGEDTDLDASSPAATATATAATTTATAAVTAGSAEAGRATPAMSPPLQVNGSGSGRGGRGLRKKVTDELKSVRKGKSPAPEKRAARLAPPPLVLNEEQHSWQADEDGEGVFADGDGELSPGTPVNGTSSGGRGKGCSICERSFTVFRAKHTCKICAQKICDDCSKNRMKLNRRLERKKGSRLCDPCARNYIHTGSGEEGTPGLFPMGSPPLAATQSDDAMVVTKGPDGLPALPRRHSVPAKTISAFIHSKETKMLSPEAKGGHQPTGTHRDNAENRSRTTSRGKSTHPLVHESHLRMRHWLSLAVVSLLVLLRVFLAYYSSNSRVTASVTSSSGGSTASAMAVTTTNSSSYSFVERALDSLLSMKTLATYILGLILFDELHRLKSGKKKASKPRKTKQRQRRRISASTGASVAQPPSLSDTTVNSKRRGSTLEAPLSPQTSQEDELEVDTGDTEGQEDEGFSLDKLVHALDEGAKIRAPEDGELRLGKFLASCKHICSFLSVFGRATSFAGSTVSGYFKSIDENLAGWPAPATGPTDWKEHSVKSVIEREVELKIANVGGKKKPSCSRCLLRLVWFVEFVEACVRHTLLDTQEENCSSGASKAYEETIGQRHPWLVRKGVNSALSAIPYRSDILAELHVRDDEEGLKPLRKALAELQDVIAQLRGVFEEHGLLDLK